MLRNRAYAGSRCALTHYITPSNPQHGVSGLSSPSICMHILHPLQSATRRVSSSCPYACTLASIISHNACGTHDGSPHRIMFGGLRSNIWAMDGPLEILSLRFHCTMIWPGATSTSRRWEVWTIGAILSIRRLHTILTTLQLEHRTHDLGESPAVQWTAHDRASDQ